MKKSSPVKAVVRGHLTVTVPVMMVIALSGLIGWLFVGGGGLLIGMIIGAAIAWPVWSFLVPRWRDWVEEQGLSPEDVQAKASSTGLLWPRGSYFERTEFKRKNGKRGW